MSATAEADRLWAAVEAARGSDEAYGRPLHSWNTGMFRLIRD